MLGKRGKKRLSYRHREKEEGQMEEWTWMEEQPDNKIKTEMNQR